MKTKNAKPYDIEGCEVVTYFKCTKCLQFFSSKNVFQDHYRNAHASDTRQNKKANSSLITRKTIQKSSKTTSFMKNVSRRGKGLVKSVIRNLCYKTKSPIKDEEVQSVVKPSTRELAVVLTHQQFHEILVTTPNKGVREIYYKLAVEHGSSGSKESDKRKFKEWRLEQIPALERSKDEDKREERTLALDIPVGLSFMFNIDGNKDDLHTILDVLTGHKMKTTILDAYIIRLVERYRSLAEKYPQLYGNYDFRHLSVHFLPVHERNQSASSMKPNMTFFPKFPITPSSLIIAPLYTCKHFYLAVVDFTNKVVRIYDSCWHFVSLDLRFQQAKKLLQYLVCDDDEEEEEEEEVWNVHFMQDCCQQIDEFSCGCYVAHFAENELKREEQRNNAQLEKPEMMQIRRNIVSELLPSTRVGSQFLEAISD